MILINSGAYVIPEFQAEIGKIPPCFLPVGNKKLIEHQVEALKQKFNEDVFVTLPMSYTLSSEESKLLDELDVSLIQTSDKFSLSEAILFALNICDLDSQEPIRLLHGDTLLPFIDLEQDLDCIGVAEPKLSYNWQTAYVHNDIPMVWCGFFSFSSKQLLMKSLALSQGDFIEAIKNYNVQRNLDYQIFKHWHDLGHINTYFKSRSKITTERAFNSLEIHENILTKKGQPAKKIQAEALWFDSIPRVLKVFTPQLINYELGETSFYQLEYLPILPLNELFVHGKKNNYEWLHVIKQAQRFMAYCNKACIVEEQKALINDDFYDLVYTKTKIRIEQYSKESGIDLNQPFIINKHNVPSINEIIENCTKKILALPSVHGILHGDLCFSNMLFDNRSDQLKIIDPRGLNSNNDFTIFGDQKYDLAKLTHSVIGLYDYIIAGRYKYDEESNYNLNLSFDIDKEIVNLQKTFLTTPFFKGITPKDIMPLVVLLFLSMLPLHSDRKDRQKAMLANSLRFYDKYVKIENFC
ncbi:hypothetical protein [Moraxella boevrei]|uniref:hypothetical protein n=1 Tax=Faucicola boevrei TaxID=346665 RepID=UPI003735626B